MVQVEGGDNLQSPTKWPSTAVSKGASKSGTVMRKSPLQTLADGRACSKNRFTDHQLLSHAAHLGAHVRAFKREGQDRFDEARLAAAIVSALGESNRIERLQANHPSHCIRQLGFRRRRGEGSAC